MLSFCGPVRKSSQEVLLALLQQGSIFQCDTEGWSRLFPAMISLKFSSGCRTESRTSSTLLVNLRASRQSLKEEPVSDPSLIISERTLRPWPGYYRAQTHLSPQLSLRLSQWLSGIRRGTETDCA